MKKIMILGAGIYQVPLILKAKEMGLYTLVVSYPGPYPGFALADECLYLDTRDEAGILKAAREKRSRASAPPEQMLPSARSDIQQSFFIFPDSLWQPQNM